MKIFLLLLACLCASLASAQQTDPALLRDPAVLASFRSMPIQEGGRIKPLDTYARFLLLRLHGKQSMNVEHSALPGVKKLSAMEWLLLSWFRPDIARDLPLFVVDNSQAVGEIGVDPKELRDRYSYNEIVKGRDELVKRAEEYSKIESEERTGVQRNVIDLATNFFGYEPVTDFLKSARTDWKKELAAILPAEMMTELAPMEKPTLWDISGKLGAMIRDRRLEALGPETSNKILNLFIDTTLRPGKTVAFIPPADPKEEAWLNIEQVVTNHMRDGSVPESELRLATAKDGLLAASGKADTFTAAVTKFVNDVRGQAEKRGELEHVDLEVTYHKADYFTNALVYYLLGFLISLVGLVAPRTGWAKWTSRIAWIALLVAVAYNTWGITVRCIINDRPPIATLYETIIFITASVAVVCLFVEAFTRQAVGLVLAGFAGALGMFLSNRFMALDGQDTMPTLEAVLITNFWLATHVTAINIGYAGSLLASLVSMAHFTYRALVKGPAVVEIRRLLTRITYGIICFGLLFSLVGTVLGGIWANDSWGRFWGWDPKENGALMIVIMSLIILHARLGGYIREIGIHILSILLGAITLFSWFGVNQLNIGLHSYGFTDGIWRALNTAWLVQLAFMLLGFWFWWQERRASQTTTHAKARRKVAA